MISHLHILMEGSITLSSYRARTNARVVDARNLVVSCRLQSYPLGFFP